MTPDLTAAHRRVERPARHRQPIEWNRLSARSHAHRIVPALRLAGIGKTFWVRDGEVEVLRRITLDVAPGELVCAVAPQGAGISMLLSIIAGLEAPSEGRIWSRARRVRGAGSDRALLFADTGLFPGMHARANVEFALRDSGLPLFERTAVARRCLDLVSMHRFEHMFAHQLTEALQHRIALARALATNPAVLLMDEPFVRLSPRPRERLHEELQAVWAATRTAILFATHDVLEAATLADRVIVLSSRPGRIVAEIPVDLPRPRLAADDAVRELAREIALGLRAAAA